MTNEQKIRAAELAHQVGANIGSIVKLCEAAIILRDAFGIENRPVMNRDVAAPIQDAYDILAPLFTA